MQWPKISISSVFANGSFLIPSAGVDDEGEYECRASNSFGQDIRKVVSLGIIGRKSVSEKQVENKSVYQSQFTSEAVQPLIISKWEKKLSLSVRQRGISQLLFTGAEVEQGFNTNIIQTRR